jgi:hypothetical protein
MARLLLTWGSQPRNPVVLPAPYQAIEVLGPLLLVRMDRASVPVSFTLAEYKALKRNPPPDPVTDDEDDDEEDDDASAEEGEESAEEREEESAEEGEESAEGGEESAEEEEESAEDDGEEEGAAAEDAGATEEDGDAFEVEAQLGTALEAPMPRTRGGRKLAAAAGKTPAAPKRAGAARKGENGIWIGNLSFATTDAGLRAFLGGCGAIARVHLAKGPDGRNKGCACIACMQELC